MAKQLWFTDAAATTHRGNNDLKLNAAATWWVPKLLSEARGANASGGINYQTNTVAGATNGVEVLPTVGVNPAEWLSEPLSADFTIAGTITINIWAAESSTSANVAINVVVERLDGATGVLTQIAKTARTTELALTTAAVNNFTVAPTSTACKRGDRLRVRVFGDDAGTMATGFTFSAYMSGSSVGTSGDSWIQFTENLTFASGTDPAVQENTGTGTNVTLAENTIQRHAQPFYGKGKLTEVRAHVGKAGAPTDNLIIEIQTDTAGSPSGTAVATVATITGASLTTTPTQATWAVNVDLTVGTIYWLVFRRSGTLSATNYFIGTTGSLNDAGKTYNGSVWAASTNGPACKLTSVVSTYYLTGTAAAIDPGSATEKTASTTRGSGAVNAVTNTAAGPTAPVQVTDSAGGNTVEWYTPPLEAVTLGGKAKFNIRCLESNAAANASLRAEIAVTAGNGTGATVWGTACIDPTVVSTEVGVADDARVAWVAGDDVAVTAGQRLRFRVYLDDHSAQPLATGFTVTVSYNGATAAAAGDTYVTLPVAVVEQVSGTNWTQPVSDTLSLADAVTTQADFARTIPDTVAVSDAQTVARDIAQTVADTLTVSDLCDPVKSAGGVALTQPIADTVGVADALLFDRAVTVADTVGVADALASQAALQRTLADTVAVADTLAYQATLLRTIADTVGLADLATPGLSTGAVDWTLPLTDTVAVADQVSSQAALARTIADTLALSDAVSYERGLAGVLADTLSVADQLAFAYGRQLAFADTISVTDLVGSQTALQRLLTDTVTVADVLATRLTGIPSEGFPGSFDPDTDHGSSGGTADHGSGGTASDEDLGQLVSGRSRSRQLAGAFTSTQGGRG